MTAFDPALILRLQGANGNAKIPTRLSSDCRGWEGARIVLGRVARQVVRKVEG